ncbi:hypothetical protein [Actinomadura sp. SCN-SB]|uniref:hypothetical protein n=1 Tax=Actinomadura sp. SCN-SB TaxID=3373092 RepID=UPI0037511F71
MACLLAHLTAHLQLAVERWRSAPDRDRGSNVVETIIIVAGFAGLAFTIYLAVSGKVQGWINKIPGASGQP